MNDTSIHYATFPQWAENKFQRFMRFALGSDPKKVRFRQKTLLMNLILSEAGNNQDEIPITKQMEVIKNFLHTAFRCYPKKYLLPWQIEMLVFIETQIDNCNTSLDIVRIIELGLSASKDYTVLNLRDALRKLKRK